MDNLLPTNFEVITEICHHQKEYQFEILDSYAMLLAEVSKGEKKLLLHGKKYPLNAYASGHIVGDKALTYLALQRAGFKIPTGDYFFITHHWREERGDGKELTDGLRYAQKIGYPVFVKPIDGSSGNFATLINDEAELVLHLQKMATKYFATMIQKPVIAQKEQRLFILDGKIEFAYHKGQAQITGDGKSCINELIEAFKSTQSSNYLFNHAFIKQNLKQHNLSFESILNHQQNFALSPNANPNTGGVIADFKQQLSPELQAWAKRIAKCFDLRVCGVDLFAPDSLDDNPELFTVLEVNANPSLKTLWDLGHKQPVMNIWQKILTTAFYENSSH